MKTAHLFALALLIPVGLAHAGEKPGTWPIDRLKNEVPEFRVVDDSLPVHSIIYRGEPVNGEDTEVFAFYASPKTLGVAKEGEEFPAVVLIHGGGGTAFSDWVMLWAERGYAAISMDLSGHRPPAPTFDADGKKTTDHNHKKELRIPLEKGGLNQGHGEKFSSIGGTISDDWPYHTVCSVMKAHTLIRSFPEVDAERTAVTGISWGGYSTCLVASLDDRFKAAVPVYGCGFLHQGESVQKPSIDALKERRDAWVAAYDPSSHLGKCTVPTFWVNGTNDIHYVLDSYAKSYSLVQGPKTFRIEPMMGHSHPAGWNPKEIGAYIDSKLKGGTPLAGLSPLTTKDGTVSLTFESESPLTGAKLFYTADEGLRSKRKWQSLPATIEGKTITAGGLPKEANTWLMTVTDERGLMVTSEVGFATSEQ
ncbi:acetylxylan esterase [Verrucomicrobiales bacterium BCK34]|nr:acetylxylan esterase [Verrucomicrobiales bacterium BCK34]